VVSLVEKAQQTMDAAEAAELADKMVQETFSLQDYLDQFRRMRKMGSLQSLLEMIPGAKGAIDPESIDERGLNKEEAIILSMTPKERANYRMIGPSRRTRIARGSGTAVFEVNKLLRKFEKTRLMMKKMTKNRKAQETMLSQFAKGKI
jgi:signal recognition particle subunit SRP54